MIRRALLLAFGLWLAATAAWARPVELELILAVDVSASVRAEEFDLQMHGYADAFRTPQVLEAIKALGKDGIAVTMMQWANPDQREVVVDWTRIYGEASAEGFAKSVDNTPRLFDMGQTAMGHALEFCLGLFKSGGFEGRRQVIDVSGDGYSNRGILPNGYRDEAIKRGITINGLAITTKEKFLPGYYQRNVIGGPGSFVVAINSYDEFASAIVAKLLREIRGAHVSEAPAMPSENEMAAISRFRATMVD
ncbi:MAG: DUF1194 domain-containing protein [Alphaproteobacteria bacterium]|nr:DUF1194 domain-containing protein [Alphaproteobacteria bacterium]